MIDNSSQKKKIILTASIAGASIVVIGVLFLSLSSSTPSRQQLGLSTLSMTDENRDKWVLDAVKGQPVSLIRDSSAKPGTPLLIKTDVQISGRDVSIGLVVEGQAGEKYVGGASKNGRVQPPPSFKIVDETGKTLTTGTFKYG
ncbi:MAG: hypothetical protein ACYS80_11305 [Planctomycetota bacterium]|jgi:hypothetical protein